MYNNIPESDFAEIAYNLGYNKYAFKGKTILLLGGSGFLGSMLKIFFLYLNKTCLEVPCQIISVDNYIGREKPVEIEDPNLIHLQHDLTVPLGMKLWGKKVDYIINCSGHASPKGPNGYELFPLETMTTGFDATKNILELGLAHNAKVLLFSSSEVLGTPPDDEIPTKETSPSRIYSDNKRSCYDTIKLTLESLGWVFRTKYSLDVKTVRLFNCVGYFNLNDKRVIPNFFAKAMRKEPVTVFVPGTQTRTLSFYTDVINGILRVLLNGTDYIYHIGKQDEEISMVNLAIKVVETCGSEGLVQLVETPVVYLEEPKRRCPSIDKAKNELGFEPKVTLDDMLRRIHNYYLKS